MTHKRLPSEGQTCIRLRHPAIRRVRQWLRPLQQPAATQAETRRTVHPHLLLGRGDLQHNRPDRGGRMRLACGHPVGNSLLLAGSTGWCKQCGKYAKVVPRTATQGRA